MFHEKNLFLIFLKKYLYFEKVYFFPLVLGSRATYERENIVTIITVSRYSYFKRPLRGAYIYFQLRQFSHY